MKPWNWEPKFAGMCAIREGAMGYCMFSTKDPEDWKSHLEDLGKLYASAWQDDLPKEDREWAEAQREQFRRWVDDSRRDGIDHRASAGSLESSQGTFEGQPAPPWPMLLHALKSACVAFLGGVKSTPADESERATADAASRVYRTYLWKTLSSDDADPRLWLEALRAFQRGFRLGHRRRTSTMKTNLPPMLDPPWLWGMRLKDSDLPGPSAARERAIRALRSQSHGREREALKQALRELYAGAWREDVPEEDREWAEAYRQVCTDWVNRRRWGSVGQSAYEGYLESSDGIFSGAPAPPWSMLSRHATEPWRAFAERVEEAPADESELATAEAAAREYWDTLWREMPLWEGDPAQVHWLAGVRAARAALSAWVPAAGAAP